MSDLPDHCVLYGTIACGKYDRLRTELALKERELEDQTLLYQDVINDNTTKDARIAELEIPPDLNGCIVMTGQEYDRIRARAERAETQRDALLEELKLKGGNDGSN